MTQRIFVDDHHDRTRVVLFMTKNGVTRDKSLTRQTLSDTWGSTNWEDLCDTPSWTDDDSRIEVDEASHS